jgi:gliding motility-associated-like protein
VQPLSFFVGLRKNAINLLMLFRSLAPIFFTIITFSSFSQLNLNPNGAITPVQAVQDILIGAGINAFNIQYNPTLGSNPNLSQPSVLEFNAGNTGFPITSGVVMTTASGGGNLNDPDINAITGGTATNGSIIEFDFVPTGDTLSFNYIFASLEYTSYTCSNFNDAFGFFISGPGINGPYSNNAINIATVPGTSVPVAINTVNSGVPSGGNPAPCAAADPNWQNNSIYFTTTYNPTFTATTGLPSFNGGTVVLAATADLVCNDTFHIKLAIANDFDTALDSGVFLEANSFTSNVVNIDIQAGATTSDTTLVANCTEGIIYFTRPPSQADDTLTIYFQTSGTAIQGTDYNFLAPGDSVMFLPGEDTIILTITPTNGGSVNDPLSLIVNAQTVTPCGDTIYAEGIVWLLLEPNFTTSYTDTTILCQDTAITVWAEVSGGFPPYLYEWNNGDVGTPIEVPVTGENGPFYFVFTATDQCGFQVTDTAVVNLNEILSIDTMYQFPSECGLATGAVSGVGSGFTGTPLYEWSGPGPNNPNDINASVWEDLPSGWYYFSIEDDVCTVNDSVFVEQDPPPTASFTPNPPLGNAPLSVLFQNNSSQAETYEWDFGNGETASSTNLTNENTTYSEEGNFIVQLIVTEGACADTAYQVIIVNLLLPLYFDMPNVFSPNNDGSNDVFTINPVNAISLDMVILNRWGNVVYESSDVNGTWNGKNKNTGSMCTPGTYFYKFTITGQDEVSETHHGFVQLVK